MSVPFSTESWRVAMPDLAYVYTEASNGWPSSRLRIT